MSQKLTKCLQAVDQFVTAKKFQYPGYEEINNELINIASLLIHRKLSIEILSRFKNLNKAMYNLIMSHQHLSNLYQIKLSDLTAKLQVSQANISPILILQDKNQILKQHIQYQLSNYQNVLIGRKHQLLAEYVQNSNLLNALIINLPDYHKVSAVHARIQPIVSHSSNIQNWQICDLGSTNGTYINGQWVNGCRILCPGDQISLAYPSPSDKAPAFLFESQLNEAYQAQSPIFDADIICLVVSPQELLTDLEKHFIELVSQSPVAVLIIIVDISGIDSQTILHLDANLTALDEWVKIQYPYLFPKTEIIQLELYPFYSTPIPNVEQSLNEFYESVVSFYEKQGEEVIFNRLSSKLIFQIRQIEQLIDAQKQTLKSEIQQIEEKLQHRTLDEWREKIKKIYSRVNDERQEILYQAKTELNRSKTDFSASFVSNNLMKKIEAFIENLEPVVTRQAGQVCIQLQTESRVPTHQALIQFCQDELLQWGDEKWQHICGIYGAGGWNGFTERSYMLLNCLPSLSLSNPFDQPPLKLNLQESLQSSFIEIQTNNSYFENQDSKFSNAATLGIKGVIAVGTLYFNPALAVIQGAGFAASLVNLVGSKLNRSQIQKMKLEQAIANLKQSVCNYYQNIARYLLEKLVQDINYALEIEERRFRRSIEGIDEQFTAHLTELKRCIDGCRNRQNDLSQEKASLEQVKRLLSN